MWCIPEMRRTRAGIGQREQVTGVGERREQRRRLDEQPDVGVDLAYAIDVLLEELGEPRIVELPGLGRRGDGERLVERPVGEAGLVHQVVADHGRMATEPLRNVLPHRRVVLAQLRVPAFGIPEVPVRGLRRRVRSTEVPRLTGGRRVIGETVGDDRPVRRSVSAGLLAVQVLVHVEDHPHMT